MIFSVASWIPRRQPTMADSSPVRPPTDRKLRIAFTESNLFSSSARIPEDAVFNRSSSLPRGPGSSNLEKSSWRNSLDISHNLKNSFTLGFLFPDDHDDDALRQSFLTDSSSSDDGDDTDLESPSPAKPIDKSADVEVKRKGRIHRAQTAPAMASMNRERIAASLQRPNFPRGSAIVVHAGAGLMVYLACGVAIYAFKTKEFSGIETLSVVDALYFCVVTMCTIGYGDIVPVTPFAKLFTCLFVLVGFGFIDALVSGMVTVVLDKQEHLLLSAVEGSHFRTAKKYFLNAKHGNRMRIRMKVAMALGVPVLCIVTGTAVMMKLEGLVLLDAFYCTIMSITTVGYGDHTFKTYSGRLFAGVWLLVSTLAMARCFLYLAEARVDKRHRLIAKWVLQRELTVGDLVQADLDHDGCISKAEFVVYKLKEMGHVESHEIADICQQFDQLDVNNSGKITLARLQEGN